MQLLAPTCPALQINLSINRSIYLFSTRTATLKHFLNIYLPRSTYRSLALCNLSKRAQLLSNTFFISSSPNLSTFYLPTLSQRAQLLAHTTALVRRRVLRPVPLAAVRRHLAPATRDIYICSLLALRVVADPSQLFAQTLVLGIVLHGVVLAAVQRHSAPRTLLEPLVELEVRGARLARR